MIDIHALSLNMKLIYFSGIPLQKYGTIIHLIEENGAK